MYSGKERSARAEAKPLRSDPLNTVLTLFNNVQLGSKTPLRIYSRVVCIYEDQQGRTRNFANPALHDATIAFFYTGPYQIARRQPDRFRTQLPILCLALVATAFHCVFDSLKKNGNSKSYPNFSSKEYSPIYRRMLSIIKETLDDEYHGPRLSAQLREWAEAGWAEHLKLDGGAAQTRHDHLQVILD
ncbi:hypothetical protein DEU56DRAFT_914609 [Suillus clintonianus]|uniref:uncharacterized protein n=1 Tax=Suillus clintonianus TaxID=1904413 RepID=UPI001B85B75B|nr:uncharacterized protein DEU56DRAFT_914609 [Suillus clintonianus]KAG2131069.1 hypothetical protein DEU56DRAFT_914609 [Suillus clintonianus]